jgi:hypothetical protein
MFSTVASPLEGDSDTSQLVSIPYLLHPRILGSDVSGWLAITDPQHA